MLSSEQPVLAGQISKTELVNVRRSIWYVRNRYSGREKEPLPSWCLHVWRINGQPENSIFSHLISERKKSYSLSFIVEFCLF